MYTSHWHVHSYMGIVGTLKVNCSCKQNEAVKTNIYLEQNSRANVLCRERQFT